jgi:adenylate cyclase, class 2
MLEIEIKSRCENPEAIAHRILNMGGKHAGTVVESDTYYNHPSRDFKTTDEALRIRQTQQGAVITYKGPKIGEKSKTRFERETEVENPQAMSDVLVKLGFSPVDTVVKKRDLYRIDDVEICLDDVEGVGRYVELEIMGEDRESAENRLFRLAGELGLSEFERRSYLELKLLRVR